MSQSERRIADTNGRFRTLDEGEEIDGLTEWTNGRLLLSNKRLLLVEESGKRTVPLSSIRGIEVDGTPETTVDGSSRYVRVELEEQSVLLSTTSIESFASDLGAATLEGKVLHLGRTAAGDGENGDDEWGKVRIQRADGGGVIFERPNEDPIDIAPADVTDVREGKGKGKGEGELAVDGEQRQVIRVEHSTREGSMETSIAGSPRCVSLLRSVLDPAPEDTGENGDLDSADRELLAALYSGVSPFAIPEFIGRDVDEVESAYQRLIDRGILEEVRMRREVSLTSRGRNVASEAIGED